MTVSKNNMWASHGLDRFCVRPYSKLGPEFQVRQGNTLGAKLHGVVLASSGSVDGNKTQKFDWIIPFTI